MSGFDPDRRGRAAGSSGQEFDAAGKTGEEEQSVDARRDAGATAEPGGEASHSAAPADEYPADEYDEYRGRTAGIDPTRGVLPLVVFLAQQVRRPFRRAVRLWQQSIQLRVVATTLLLSLGVVSMLGVVVIGQVRNGLQTAKEKSSISQAMGGFQSAQTRANESRAPLAQPEDTSSSSPSDSGGWLNALVEQLASGGQGQYSVVALSPQGTSSSLAPEKGSNIHGARSTGAIDPDRSISTALRRSVSREGGMHQQFSQLIYRRGQHVDQPGLVVGKAMVDPNGNQYQLFYLFSFEQEEQTLGLVKGTLATAGVFVVVLLGAIAWVVVRQVVTPVRMAARIAERLAAGNLEERMKVSGEDDIALLGESFNKMASNLQKQIRQLEALSRMQRRFVSDVSHELRTPLTTVRMAADLLYESRDDFDIGTQRSAELLQDQLDRFESLLGDLLEISRFDAGAAVLDAEPVDLREIAARVVQATVPLAQEEGVEVRVDAGEDPVVAEVDPRRIERVVRNLVSNAVEHAEQQDVVVRLAASPGAVAVGVRDYGLGLKPGEASRVFNRFWRADPARARTTGGTGLGLSIALEDAQLHGGWLQAWGEPGGGSQFRLTLPRTVGAELVRSPLPLEPEDSRGNRGLRAPGVPFRRLSNGATASRAETSGGAWPQEEARKQAKQAGGHSGWPTSGNWTGETSTLDSDSDAASPTGVGGTVSRRVGSTASGSGTEEDLQSTDRRSAEENPWSERDEGADDGRA